MTGSCSSSRCSSSSRRSGTTSRSRSTTGGTRVEKWLTTWTAGRAANELRVPAEIGTDLRAIVRRRNLVAHHSWRFYIGWRGKVGDRAVAEYMEWFAQQAWLMGLAYNGVMTILGRAVDDEDPPDDAELTALWRDSVPDRIEDVSVPDQADD
jgi:hypothetical protein